MSIFHLSVKTVSRASGRSAVAAAAYRAGACLTAERDGVTHDYRRRSGIEVAFIIVPKTAEWATDREVLWNTAERAETRKNSTLAREYQLALPEELDADQRTQLVRDFSNGLATRFGVAVDAAIHAPSRHGDDRNHHAHILTTTRSVLEQGMGKKTRELDDQKSGAILEVREKWASLVNEALARNGSAERVDHRSLRDRNINKAPTVHLGVAAASMERRGVATERGNLNRVRVAANSELAAAKIAISQAENDAHRAARRGLERQQRFAWLAESRRARLAASAAYRKGKLEPGGSVSAPKAVHLDNSVLQPAVKAQPAPARLISAKIEEAGRAASRLPLTELAQRSPKTNSLSADTRNKPSAVASTPLFVPTAREPWEDDRLPLERRIRSALGVLAPQATVRITERRGKNGAVAKLWAAVKKHGIEGVYWATSTRFPTLILEPWRVGKSFAQKGTSAVNEVIKAVKMAADQAREDAKVAKREIEGARFKDASPDRDGTGR